MPHCDSGLNVRVTSAAAAGQPAARETLTSVAHHHLYLQESSRGFVALFLFLLPCLWK